MVISVDVFLLVNEEIFILEDWVTGILQIGQRLVCSRKLRVASGFYVSSVVLVHIIDFVVDIDGTLDILSNIKSKFAPFIGFAFLNALLALCI